MNNYVDAFNLIADEQKAKTRKQDLDDLHNEQGGNDVGRISRFLTSDSEYSAIGKRQQEEKKKHQRETLNTLLITNAVYARLFGEVNELLKEALNEFDVALGKLNDLRDQLSKDRDAILDRAIKLEDDSLVFRGADDKPVRRDGSAIDPALIGHIIWQDNHARFDEIQALDGRINKIDETIDDVRAGQAELGDIHARIHDDENPVSADDLSGIKSQIEDIRDDLKESLEDVGLSSKPAQTTNIDGVAQTAIPDISGLNI